MAKCTISTRPHDKASICETFAAIRGGEILCKFYKFARRRRRYSPHAGGARRARQGGLIGSADVVLRWKVCTPTLGATTPLM